MSTPSPDSPRSIAGVTAAALIMIACCAAGPAALGALAGSVIGGWLGIVCAVVFAGAVGVLLERRRRAGGC